MYEYKATVHHVIDGDTVSLNIDLGFNVILKDQHIRLQGLDCPESESSDKIEKVYGALSKDFTMEFLTDTNIRVKTTKEDKFGRVLGEIINEQGLSLNAELLAKHYAVPYNGENKDLIARAHLKNRELLYEEAAP